MLYRGDSTELHLERRNVDIHWVERSGRALEAGKKQTHMQRHRSVKGHVKVEETVQDQQETKLQQGA